jgi:hypothetical protein
MADADGIHGARAVLPRATASGRQIDSADEPEGNWGQVSHRAFVHRDQIRRDTRVAGSRTASLHSDTAEVLALAVRSVKQEANGEEVRRQQPGSSQELSTIPDNPKFRCLPRAMALCESFRGRGGEGRPKPSPLLPPICTAKADEILFSEPSK